jgi:hypothetical protein
MAKSKNHTNHNQGHKNHRNGIKKAKQSKSLKGVCEPILCIVYCIVSQLGFGVIRLLLVYFILFVVILHGPIMLICFVGGSLFLFLFFSSPSSCARILQFQMDPKFLRNLRFAKANNKRVAPAAPAAAAPKK